jgi:enoyl-CoA hydratase/carnithine racemase
MDFTKMQYTVNGSVAVISMNSPKNLNAFDETMVDELVAALTCAEQDGAVRAVLLRSTGKNFSAGGDIGAMYRGITGGEFDFSGMIEKVANVSLTIKELSKPVIAAVSGAVAGAAFNVALACDFCIAADNAQFIQAFVNLALIPDAGGFYLMTRAVGVNKATELAMTGRPVDAAEAKALGFVCQVCAPDVLDETAGKFAKRVAAGPAFSYACMKRLIMQSEFKDFKNYISEEVKAQAACAGTEDYREGVRAFVEKRKPKFQ